MRATPDWPVADLLSHRARSTPAATAAIEAADGRTWTYDDLDRLVDAATARLRSYLPEPAARESTDRPTVAVATTVDVAFVVRLFAAWRAGARVVPVDAATPPSELSRRLDRVDAALVVDGGDVDLSGAAADARETDSIGLEAVSLDDLGASDELAGDGDRATGDSGGPEPDRWHPTEPTLVLFTSGTTGAPKGVTLSHRNLVASAAGSAARLGLDPDERWLDCLPTHHMGGLAPIVRSTCYGTAVVLQSEFDREVTVAAMADHDVTGVSLVPTQLRRLLDDGWTPPSSLRFALVGGAPAGEALVSEAASAGVPVCPTYGTTETASQLATLPPGEADADTRTVGSPLIVADVTIVDPEDGRPVDRGETGELVVDGPIVSPGYLDDDATAAAFGEFGLHTGDLASRDESGRLTIHGRLDDAIQTGGETVHPRRVASALRATAEVEAAAVVGLPDPEWGERVAALVVPADEATVDAAAIRRGIRDGLANHEVPKTIRAVDRLPRTDSGTVDREAVRDRLAGQREE